MKQQDKSKFPHMKRDSSDLIAETMMKSWMLLKWGKRCCRNVSTCPKCNAWLAYDYIFMKIK